MLTFGALLLVCSQNSPALGLGEISVESMMNQKLDARIELVSVDVGDIINMEVRLAEPDVFKSAGIPRPLFLTKLDFEAVETGENAGYIRVTSKERIREPYINFIIEVKWPNGRALREYTVLLKQP
jgi:pilus assembly protein FimV